MGTTAKLAGLTLLSLLFLPPEGSAQIIRGRPRPAPTPADTRPALGLLGGPTSRASDTDTGGLEFALFGEKPIERGWRARGEIGAAIWNTDPAFEGGITRLTLSRATAGLYRVHGRSPVHTFIGAGVGLYRHRLRGAPGSGFAGGAHGGMGIEYAGRLGGFSSEVRVGLAPKSSTPHGAVLHASVLFGVKRMF